MQHQQYANSTRYYGVNGPTRDSRRVLASTTTSNVYEQEPLLVSQQQQKRRRRSKTKICLITFIILVSVLVILALMGGIAALITWLLLNKKYPYEGDELHWDWRDIDVNNVSFPRSFLWGVATSAHQVEGNNINNQWYKFERKDIGGGKTPIKDGSVSGKAADMYNLLSHDLDLMKNELHLNSYRFSIEWSRIEPQRGQYSQEALDHYHAQIDEMLSKGIEPIVTIHHLTDPIWFSEMGAFEKEENIAIFVDYCKFIYQQFQSKVKMWITINGINVYALQGYQQGVWPPGKQDSKLAAQVMKNMAESHVQAYYSLKEMNGTSKDNQIGLVLNMMQFDPYNSTNTLDRMISNMVENDYKGCLLSFYKSGIFHFTEPGVVDLKYENPKAKGALDFFGINYYGNTYAKFTPTARQKFIQMDNGKDVMTDMPHFPVYPEGIYRAIVLASKELKKPILITENGIADAKDDRRDLFIKRYLYAVSKAISEGHQVIGYQYWSLTDCWEWDEGYQLKFGLYELNRNTMERKMRKGARSFVNIVKRARRL